MAPALMRMNLGLFIFYKTDFAIIKDRIEATPSEIYENRVPTKNSRK